MVDLVIHGDDSDIAVEGGIIVERASVPAKREIDARGLWVLPGVIDVHVHFNEPGREHWEGAYTCRDTPGLAPGRWSV